MTAWDQTAYDALGVPLMVRGTSFPDPVTSVLTTKVTDVSTNSGKDCTVYYATLGLQISQAWGANGDQYTLSYQSPDGSGRTLEDYQIGGTLTNKRPAPAGEAMFAFARTAGNEQIMYVVTGSQLQRYDTSVDAYADTGSFPYAWTTRSVAAWLQLNLDETRATAIETPGTGTSLDLTTGAVITQSPAGIDELYISGDVAFISIGSIPEKHWNLATDTISNLDIPAGWQWLVHSATPGGFLFHTDLGAGGGVMPSTRILDNNVAQPEVIIQGYWSGKHSSGHWQDFPAGTDPHILQSNYGLAGAPYTDSWQSSIIFINTLTAGKRLLGHHYSILNGYWTHPFANQSHDGRLVQFTSNMNNSSGRTDVFVMEVPRT